VGLTILFEVVRLVAHLYEMGPDHYHYKETTPTSRVGVKEGRFTLILATSSLCEYETGLFNKATTIMKLKGRLGEGRVK
jgi:hypothetical protein